MRVCVGIKLLYFGSKIHDVYVCIREELVGCDAPFIVFHVFGLHGVPNIHLWLHGAVICLNCYTPENCPTGWLSQTENDQN